MTIYAEDVNYWKTGTSSPDMVLDRAKAEIVAAGGRVVDEAYRADAEGRAAYLLEFVLGAERYRVVWPVLPTRSAKPVDLRAARIQAVTMLYHDVKSKAVAAKVLGARAAFFPYLLLEDGRTAAQLAAPDLAARYPRLITGAERCDSRDAN